MEVLTPDQKAFFESNGYLVLENRIPMEIIEAIRNEIAAFEEISKGMTAPDDRLDLEPSHTPEEPRLRRIKLPHTQSDVMRDLMYSDHVLAPARDLIGLDPDALDRKSLGLAVDVDRKIEFLEQRLVADWPADIGAE